MKRLQKALRDVKRRKAGLQKKSVFSRVFCKIREDTTNDDRSSYPKVVGSNPFSATTKETSFVRKHGLPCKGRKTLGETLACECGNLNCRR